MSAVALSKLLAKHRLKIVFAESCTGGLAAGALSRVPGISAYHCGGMVVYREETKTAYLGISPRVLKKHNAVSEIVAKQMAVGVLKKTPEANLALSVTGHLGPNAPVELDGVVYIGWAVRNNARISTTITYVQCPRSLNRGRRQRLVVKTMLKIAVEYLRSRPVAS